MKTIKEADRDEVLQMLRTFLKEKGLIKPFMKYLELYKDAGINTGTIIKDFLELAGQKENFNKYLGRYFKA